MYNSNLSCSVFHSGQNLREFNGKVHLPYSSDYSLKFQNHNNVRCVFWVEIDGQRVTDDEIVLNPFEVFTLEGFLENRQVKNKFRFIEKTSEISNFRGDRQEDGIIKVSFQFEEFSKVYAKPVNPVWYPPSLPKYNEHWITFGNLKKSYHGGPCGQSVSGPPHMNLSYNDDTPIGCSTTMDFSSSSDIIEEADGITVKGKETNQNFQEVTVNNLNPRVFNITLKLTGREIQKPTYVKVKKTCPTCGRVNKSMNKFCYNCGTAIV